MSVNVLLLSPVSLRYTNYFRSIEFGHSKAKG